MWKKFDEIYNYQKAYIETDRHTGQAIYNEGVIESDEIDWLNEVVELSNAEIQEVVEQYQSEEREKWQVVLENQKNFELSLHQEIGKLKMDILMLKERIINLVSQ